MWGIFSFCCGKDEEKVEDNKRIKSQKRELEISTPIKTKPIQPGSPKSPDHFNTRFIRKNRYEGEQLDGVPHGNGSMLYSNGDFYRGEWVSGIKEGRGLQIYQQLGTQYEGQWQNDKPNGNGKFLHPNNSYYNGQFRNGVKHGKGQFFDNQKKKLFDQQYENGVLKICKQVQGQRSREEQFPTLALDKERFNTEDLNQFEQRNPEIKQYDLFFLLKYYGLCKITELEFIKKNIKDWNIKQVMDFLKNINMAEYAATFYNNRIKGKDLITLTESQLKDDLHMKMGDRKRLLNYLTFLVQLEMNHGEVRKKQSDKQKKYMNFHSRAPLKKKMPNVKSRPLDYQPKIQSIIEESQSESSSQKRKIKDNILQEEDKDYFQDNSLKYGSVVVDCVHRIEKYASLEEKMSAESERKSEGSLNRKEGSELLISNNNNPILMKIDSMNKNPMLMLQDELKRRATQEQKNDANNAAERDSSSTSSDQSLKQLTRKRTEGKPHHHTEIRQLYEFLKNHRTLEFLIKEKDIEKLQLIGQGGYGKVYKGKYIGQLIAIKDYLKTNKHRHKQDFMKEVQIISDLKHPNIVLYMGMCITASRYTLITEYMENGSLYDQLHQKKKKFTLVQKIEIAYEVVKGMVYLHNMKKILHRDLKSSNVLIGEDWNQVKLCDFGLSAQKKKQKKHKRVGTYQWMAPQVIRNEDKIDETADVYSFGVILWELLSEKIPYEGLSEHQIIGLVGYDCQHELQDPLHECQFLRDIMKECLKKNQQERPTFIQIQSLFQERIQANELTS